MQKHFAESLDVRAPGWRERPILQWASPLLLNLDSFHHTRRRRLVVREFTPRIVEGLRPQVERLVDELLDNMAEHDVGEGRCRLLPEARRRTQPSGGASRQHSALQQRHMRRNLANLVSDVCTESAREQS